MDLEPLKADALETPVATSETAWLERAALLAPHLSDCLVRATLLDDAKLSERPPIRLCTFTLRFESPRAPDSVREDVGLYARLDDEGWLAVGRTDRRGAPARQRLAGFDRRADEVISLVATRQGQATGLLAELWVVGRSWSEAQGWRLWAYHGHASLTADGEPHLTPAPDASARGSSRWQRADLDSANSLPALVQTQWVLPSAGDDLFAPQADQDTETLTSDNEPAPISIVGWTPGAVVWAQAGDRLCLRVTASASAPVVAQFFASGDSAGPEGQPPEWRATPRVRALALQAVRAPMATRRRQAPPLVELRVLVADDTSVSGFRWRPGYPHVAHVWTQRFPRQPRALALVPASGDADGWAGVLIAFRDGTLARYEYLGPQAVHAAWDVTWEQLEGDHAPIEARLARLQMLLETSDDSAVRQALLRRALELMLRAEGPLRDQLGAVWIATWAPLIANEEPVGLAWPVATLLTGELRRWGAALAATAAGRDDFILDLTHAVYHGGAGQLAVEAWPAPLRLQEWIDREVRHIALRVEPSSQPLPFRQLLEYSTANRAALLEKPRLQGGEARRAGLHLDHWANHFVLTDAFPVPPEIGRVEQLAWLRAADVTWLVLGSRHGLAWLKVDADKPVEEAGIRQQVCRLPGLARLEALRGETEDKLLVGFDDGSLRVFELGATGATTLLLCTPADWCWPEWAADLSALTSVRAKGGGWIVAAARVSGSRSAVQLFQLDAAGRPVGRARDFLLKDAGALALALGGGVPGQPAAYHLGVGEGSSANNNAQAELWEFDAALQRLPLRFARALDGSVLNVTFDNPAEPCHAAEGDRSGLIWGVDLTQANTGTAAIERLRWIYQLQGPIVALAGVQADAPAFLAVSEGGQLVLLDAVTGRRLWKQRFPTAPRAMAVLHAGKPHVALAFDDDSVRLLRFIPIAVRDEAFDKAAAWFAGTAEPSGGQRQARQSLPEAIWAQRRLNVRALPVSDLLRAMRYRSARAKVMHYLIRRGPELSAEERKAIVDELSYRDLALLSSYLPNDASAWDALIFERLRHAEASEDRGDGGRDALVSAWAASLLRRSHQKPTPQEILRDRPSDQLLDEERWLRLALAHSLLQALHRSGADVVELIERVSALPPACVGACARVAGEAYAHAKVLSALTEVIAALRGRIDHMRPAAVEALVRELPAGVHAAGAVRALARLFALPQPQAVAWTQQRIEALDAVRELGRHAAAGGGASVQGRVGAVLTQLLPRHELPTDTQRLSDRQAWLREAQQALVNEPRVEGTDSWTGALTRLLALTRPRLRGIVDLEMQHCNALVRPWVRLLGHNRLGHDQVRLRLELLGEGAAPRRDVVLEVDAAGSEGLQPTPDGVLRFSLELARYPSELSPVVLHGRLAPGQRGVRVTTTLRTARSGRNEHSDSWWLPLAPIRHVADDRFYPAVLRRTFESLRDAVFTPRTGVVVLVVDDDVGRDAFLESANVERAARFVSLDQLLPVRAGRALTGEDARSLVTELQALAPRDAPLVALVAVAFPDAFPAEFMSALREHLRAWADEREAPRLVIVVPALEAARRCDLWASLDTVDANRPGVLLDNDEIRDWLARQGLSAAEAMAALAELGGHLRLLRLWPGHLAYHRAQKIRHPALRFFFEKPDVQCILLDDIEALPGRSLLLGMAAAVCSVQVRLDELGPGLTPRDDIHARASRNKGRLLQPAGERITPKSLDSLRAETSLSRVWIEGYAARARTEARFDARAADLLALPGISDVGQRRFSVARAIIDEVAGVWLTASPYRHWILQLYEKQPPGAAPDAAVYSLLTRGQQALLDVFSIVDLTNLTDDALGMVLQSSIAAHRRQELRYLLRLWACLRTTDAPEVLRAVFGPSDLRRVPQGTHSDRTLMALGERKGATLYVGGGELRPGVWSDYLFWLDPEHDLTLEAVQRARDNLRYDEQGRGVTLPSMRLVGPGADGLGFDDARHIGVLGERDLRCAAAHADLRTGFAQRLRAQQPLSARSPYRSTGALPPGSPLFKGRGREIQFIRDRLRAHSVLIVGARRIGKTSLLNQISDWVGREPDLLPIAIDLQGMRSYAEFEQALERWARAAGLLTDAGDPSWLHRIVAAAATRSQQPVFLLNEIDGLLDSDPELFVKLRALGELGSDAATRCVMVGYSAALQDLANPHSPLFHFTEGLNPQQRALRLRNLEPEAARQLVDLLEQEPLGLAWASGQRERGYKLLLDRTYGVAWLLQTFCQALVQRLEQARRVEITLDDVIAVTASAGEALEPYLLGNVGDTREQPGARGKPAGVEPRALAGLLRRRGLRLVLLALARERYFLPREGRAPLVVDEPALMRLSPLERELGFSVGEALDVVKRTLQDLLLSDERGPFMAWFVRENFKTLFHELTLTLALEIDPVDPERFGFLLHIFPRELWRRHRSDDPRLERTFSDEAREFWILFRQLQEEAS